MPSITLTVINALAWIVERQGNGQNSQPSGGGGGGGGSGTFFLLTLLLAGHGAGFGVLLVVLAVYFAISYFSGEKGFAWHPFGGASSGRSYGGPYAPPPAPPAPAGTPRTAEEAAAFGSGRAGSPPASGAGAYDDTHPVGVPDRFRGSMLEGSSAEAGRRGGGVDEGLAAISAHDPEFTPEGFLTAAQTSFFTIQQAWMECKPEMSRAVMADGLAQQTAMQLEEYRRDNRRNRLDGLTVRDATIVGAHSDNVYDTVTVRFAAASADYDVDAGSGRFVKGSRDIQNWTEDWIFQRSSGAVTRPAGLLTHQCPNCQAPISVNAQGVCEYCGKTVMSGQYDWVLARIEQVD